MLIIKACLAVATFAHATTAFVPFIPDWRCKEFNTCKTKRTDVEIRGSDLAHIEILQRISVNSLPHEVVVQRMAERLAQKYQQTAKRSTPVQERDASVTYKVVSAAVPTTTNSVGIDQDGTDYSYFAQVKIGSRGHTMNMLLDTGAGTTWVMGHDCTSNACKNHNNFGPQDSDTFKETGVDFELYYGAGNVSGHMATDSFTLAGLTVNPTFGIATFATEEFNAFPIDGILGLAQSKGTHDTFMETLVAAKLLKANMFGISISRSTDGPNNGVLNFGAPDPTRYVGDLAYTDIYAEKKEDGDWAIAMDDISFDGKKAGIQYKVAYIDTGTSYMFSKPEEVKRVHAIIPGATSDDGITWRVPCETTMDLKLTFGANTYAISSRDWVGPMRDGRCTSNIYGYDVVGEAWLLGDTFLKNVYAVFDFDQHRIGLASRPAPPPPVTTTASSTGGPNSSLSSAVSPSTGTPTDPGSSPVASSNTLSTGPATADSSHPTGAPGTLPLGAGSHQTSSSGTSVAEAVQSSATPTIRNQNSAPRVDVSLSCAALSILGLVALIS